MAGVFIFAVVVIGAVGVFVAMQVSKQTDEAWRIAADKLGLTFQGGGLLKGRKLTGQAGACTVHVDIHNSRSGGKSSTQYTRFRIRFPDPLLPGLRLTRQGFFAGVASFFGSQDIEVGDRDFDDAVVVKAARPQDVVRFLTPGRRVRIHRLLRNYEGMVLDSEQIEWSKRGMVRSAEELISVVRSLVGSATAIAAPAEEDAPLERALEARAGGDLDGALGHLEEAHARRAARPAVEPPPLPRSAEAESRPDPLRPPPEPAVKAIDETLMKGELLYLGGRHEEAKHVFEEARGILPRDPEIGAWAAQTGETSQAPSPSGGTTDPHAPAPLDVDSVCQALFVDVASSLDANRAFEARYQDREIEWEGTLKSAQPFSFDFVLGNAGGTKALVEVFDLPEVSIGGSRVTAVVGLPKGEDRPLADHAGHRIRIRGRLARVDSFMRNVFVRDGSWEAV